MPDDSGGDNQDKQIIPTNLVFNVELTGQNDENPFGDGSGKIKLSASAVNSVNYSFRFGTGDVTESNTGIVEFIYSDFGTKSYTVNVLAYSSTGDYISSAKNITIYVEAKSDEDILAILSGSTEKTWRVNASFDAHFGNGDKSFKYTTWWEAPSFSKNDAGFYDDELSLIHI